RTNRSTAAFANRRSAGRTRSCVIRSARAGRAAVALALLTQTNLAEADPQVTADLNLGVAGSGEDPEVWGSTSFLGGVRGELLWGRGRDADFGVGPDRKS